MSAECTESKCNIGGPVSSLISTVITALSTIPKSKRKIEMLTLDGCPHCEAMQSVLKEEGKLDQITIIAESDPRGIILSESLGINDFPTFVVDDIHVCDLVIDDDESKPLNKLKCTDGTEVDI